ncbi:hypothetical protein ACWEO2_33260 [Nocardia sp. NPDC004278]
MVEGHHPACRVSWLEKWTRTTHTVNGLPAHTSNTVLFAIGRWPDANADEPDVTVEPHVTVEYSYDGKSDAPAALWQGLVSLSRKYLEPRLLDEILDRVRQGERVRVVGGLVDVDLEGFHTLIDKKRPFRRWSEVLMTDEPDKVHLSVAKGFDGGWFFDKDRPNAILLPRVYTALTSEEDRARVAESAQDPWWLRWASSRSSSSSWSWSSSSCDQPGHLRPLGTTCSSGCW